MSTIPSEQHKVNVLDFVKHSGWVSVWQSSLHSRSSRCMGVWMQLMPSQWCYLWVQTKGNAPKVMWTVRSGRWQPSPPYRRDLTASCKIKMHTEHEKHIWCSFKGYSCLTNPMLYKTEVWSIGKYLRKKKFNLVPRETFNSLYSHKIQTVMLEEIYIRR